MPAELHIRLQPNLDDPGEISLAFPFEPGQSILSQTRELIIIDLGNAEDTNSVQDWFLNALDEVYSFYIVSDEPVQNEDEG